MRVEPLGERYKEASDLISQRLMQRLEGMIKRAPLKLAAFAPLSDEPDLTPAYTVLLEKYKNQIQWHFPVMEPEYCLVPIEVDGQTSLKKIIEKWPKSALGFRIPPFVHGACAASALDLILVPGVIFGPQGQRIGRGKGYYDRILARYPNALTLALAFDFQVRVDMPTEQAWDRRVDWIVTESREIRTEGFYKKTALFLK